jgi:acyl-CoA thioesterase|tara:strand:+ start:3831 stop:4256 length:426 start_codon:yes stop_codon:yes gene_type:complete
MSDALSRPRVTELAKMIGLDITDFSEGRCIVECTIREDHLNMGGAVHGGIHATILDTSMGGTLVSTLPKKEWCATAQLDISYINSVGVGTRLIASSEVVRRGRNLAHVEGRLIAEDGTLVATAKGTWAVWEGRPSSQGASQ